MRESSHALPDETKEQIAFRHSTCGKRKRRRATIIENPKKYYRVRCAAAVTIS